MTDKRKHSSKTYYIIAALIPVLVFLVLVTIVVRDQAAIHERYGKHIKTRIQREMREAGPHSIHDEVFEQNSDYPGIIFERIASEYLYNEPLTSFSASTCGGTTPQDEPRIIMALNTGYAYALTLTASVTPDFYNVGDLSYDFETELFSSTEMLISITNTIKETNSTYLLIVGLNAEQEDQ